MEIIQNRYGVDRVIEKISTDKLRITGESEFSRISEDENGIITMYDFEGGPCLNVGGKIQYLKSNWKINSISVSETKIENLPSVIVEVEILWRKNQGIQFI